MHYSTDCYKHIQERLIIEVLSVTSVELNEVRNLKAAIVESEKTLELWRRTATLKVPTQNGLPKVANPSSSVERYAVKIADASHKLKELKRLLEESITRLESKIYQEVSDETARTLFILRYVEGMQFRDISEAMGYSEQHIYRLHNKTLQRLKI